MRSVITLVSAVLLLFALEAAVAVVDRTPEDSVIAELKRRIPDLMTQHAVPGLSIALVRGNSVDWSAGFGRTQASDGTPVTDRTVFEAASLSKPVFAFLVLRLAERGRFDLDAPLQQYAPLPDGANSRLRDVTARHALTHTTGLPNWVRDDSLRLDHAPGTRWQYSGEGFVLLQHAVEHLTDTPLPELAETWVFDPLGMTQSSYRWRSSYDTTTAIGHDTSGVPQDKIRPSAETVDQYGAAATLHTTARDYARFLRAVLSDSPTADSNGEPLLSDSLRQAMIMPAVDVEPDLDLWWGLGWGLQTLTDETWFFHWGSNPHFRAFAMGNRDRNRAFVVFTNGAQGLELMDEVAAIVTGRDHPLFSFYMLHPTD